MPSAPRLTPRRATEAQSHRGFWKIVLCVSVALWLVIAAVGSDGVDAQARRGQPARRPAAPVAPTIEPAVFDCPSLLGEGVKTQRMYCDVLTGRDSSDGIIINLPPHTGPVTLTFDLHNRHTYSEEQIKANLAYRRYTATIGALTANNNLLTRAVIQSEFRTAADLVDRVSGGAAPGGVKAVAPTGLEPIVITIPAEEESVSILGEKLSVDRLDGPPDNFTTPGRPVAVISNVMLEYRPAPARRPAATPAR